jgi:N-methylhydantoinase A
MPYQLGVDIGGTFTDCVAIDGNGRVLHAKTPSTHATSPVEGVVAGVELLAAEAGLTVDELLLDATRLSHGTTIGTNLVVEGKGANVGLIATAGHGDALAMMRGLGRTAGVPVDQVFSVHETDKPAPLVPPGQVVEVAERVTVTGAVLAPLDAEAARETVRRLVADHDVEAVAVALLWSFRNPDHEETLKRILEEEAPGVFVSISSDVSPRQGEYERTVATVINSYVGPASSSYLDELAEKLAGQGLERAPFIMQANGGVAPVEFAQRLPLRTIGSGPAGGLAGTAAIAAACGHENVIATDMGGTSFEVGLVVGGHPILAATEVLQQYTFHMAHLDLRSIACGGGSIARVDPHSGSLRVGPESAGSTPGPACYGEGTEPTVTDADIVLGLIDADRFLGGRMTLDPEAARRAVATIAEPLGVSIEEAAAGIVEVNSFSAATLIRQRTLEQGLDPRDFALYAFGGAGPVHAFAFAEELGVGEVVIPLGNGASTLSAYGIAASDVMSTFEQECRISAPFSPSELAEAVAAVEGRALAAMEDAGFERSEVELRRTALMRYAEQLLQELPLDIPADRPIDDASGAALAERFDSEYARLYGEGARAVFQAVEIFAIRIAARVPLGFTAAIAGSTDGTRADLAPGRTRQVFWPQERAWVETAVHDDADLAPGTMARGPAVIDLPHTAVCVAAGQSAHRDQIGNVVLITD